MSTLKLSENRLRRPPDQNPYRLPEPLAVVWRKLGKPTLHGNGPWYCSVLVSPALSLAMTDHMCPRNANGTYSEVIVRDLAELMTRGRWLANTDPIIYTISGKQIQGNHRFMAIRRANCTISFNAILGVPDEAERELGRVFAWSRSDLIGEDKRTTAVAMIAAKRANGNLSVTLGRGYDIDIAVMAEIYREAMVELFSKIPSNKKKFTRAAIAFALVEGLIIDRSYNGHTQRTDAFISAMVGDFPDCRWGHLHNQYILNSVSGSVEAQIKDYHSTVCSLKRALVEYEYTVDTKGRHPDKESSSAEWGSLSAGINLQAHLDNYITERVAAIKQTEPLFGADSTLFKKLMSRLV